jgi:malate synthase
MVINAFNSGARIYMADFEDANSPTWGNVVGGQQNLTDAIDRTISLEQGEKRYELNDEVAVLLVRPRGWHLQERHVEVDGKHVSAGLFDFGVYLHRNWERLLERGSGPYFYLPNSRAISRRACGTTSSASHRTHSGSRVGRSRRPS